MADPEQLALAVVTGLGFGYVVHRVGSSAARLAIILFALWTMQTGSQYIYRALDGTDVAREVVIVTSLRLTFALVAIAAVWLLNARDDR